IVVLADPTPPNKLGKLIYEDVLLDVSYLPWEQVQSPEEILGQSHLAGSFRTANVILDPSGELTNLQAAVAKDYAKRRWVRTRCEHARDKILANLHDVNEAAPFHDQVLPWLFATGVTTHVLLVAGLKNPTVRRRYVAVHELLVEYAHPDFHNALLELLGCAQLSRERVEEHLATLTEVFDVAAAVVKTPFFFASDISDVARPIAIDGSRELIERGYHREAVFWMAATYSRCQKVLYHDAPEALREGFSPGYRLLLDDLGISSFADLRRRGERVKRFLPRVWEMAEAIMAASPEIEE
ncbi:MAG TPA: hypothetical protein VLA19_06500, partial [Herpetosiphonaceae bacterium]|nr:hypothetical protein [Herpetosiphonaceae bacterium]